MKDTFKFTIIVPQSWNYCPADLMKQYVKANARASYCRYDGRVFLGINGIEYKYEHWEIKENGDGTETVTVYLVKNKRGNFPSYKSSILN